MAGRELSMRLTEALLATLFLVTLAAALLRDFVSLLRGRLLPKHESEYYWRILYSWILGGLLFGMHRLAASKVSWRIFPILNAYGAALLCVGEIYFKDNEGDPSVDPTRFSRGTALAADSLAGAMLLLPFAMWLRDL